MFRKHICVCRSSVHTLCTNRDMAQISRQFVCLSYPLQLTKYKYKTKNAKKIHEAVGSICNHGSMINCRTARAVTFWNYFYVLISLLNKTNKAVTLWPWPHMYCWYNPLVTLHFLFGPVLAVFHIKLSQVRFFLEPV